MKFSEKLKNVLFRYNNIPYLEELNTLFESEPLIRDIVDSSIHCNPADSDELEVLVAKFMTDHNLNRDILDCDTVLNTNRPYSIEINDTEKEKLNYMYVVNKILLSVYPKLKAEQFYYNFDNDLIYNNISTILINLSEKFESVLLDSFSNLSKEDKKSYINRYIIQCVSKYDMDSFTSLLFQNSNINKSFNNLAL